MKREDNEGEAKKGKENGKQERKNGRKAEECKKITERKKETDVSKIMEKKENK